MQLSILALIGSVFAFQFIEAATIPRFDVHFRAMVRSGIAPEDGFVKRVSLGERQPAACTSVCSSSSDEAAFAAGNACSSTDTACLCAALEELSSACLECALQSEDISQSSYATTCSAGSSGGDSGGSGGGSCSTECTSSSDINAENAFLACSSSDTACQCNALEELSTACLSCLLQASDITEATYDSTCDIKSPKTNYASRKISNDLIHVLAPVIVGGAFVLFL